ncbi:MAG: hypothetical protein JNM18_21520 [Planctomycetaceae bacterium]|nr:hypothetical protein [Planctomycetaceae bacterium]
MMPERPAPMDSQPGNDPAVGTDLRRAWPTVPAWLISVLLHSSLLVTLALTIQAAPRGAAVEEPGRDVGLVLKKTTERGEDYYESDSKEPPSPDQATSAAAPSNNPAQVVGDRPPVDVAAALPQGKPLIGLGSTEAGALPGAAGLTQGTGPTTGVGKRGAARTKVYGLQGEGFKFVYVFDRSASMGNERYSPLQAAKRELRASLDSLEPQHQFQIVFYNHEPRMFALSGVPVPGVSQKLAFATDPNKQAARQFIEGIIADGATEYVPALELGLGLAPDVLFFLTDAGTPLSEGQIARITRANRAGTVLHSIEFGEGPPVGGESTLQRLSRENFGRYVYIDITKLPTGP